MAQSDSPFHLSRPQCKLSEADEGCKFLSLICCRLNRLDHPLSRFLSSEAAQAGIQAMCQTDPLLPTMLLFMVCRSCLQTRRRAGPDAVAERGEAV